ncbi:MAG: hypothetical protein KBC15_01585 [Candidatus Levybacteria bacterium]|nr:hypothetical protein [Candidatus Levybacteria bacterium]
MFLILLFLLACAACCIKFSPPGTGINKSGMVGTILGLIFGLMVALFLGAWQHQESVTNKVPLEASSFEGTVRIKEGDVNWPTLAFTDNLCDDGDWGWDPLDLSISKWWWICIDVNSDGVLLVPRGYLDPPS